MRPWVVARPRGRAPSKTTANSQSFPEPGGEREIASRLPVGSFGAGYDRTRPVVRRSARRVKIHEADAKSLLVAQGLPVPAWEVARTPSQARAAAVRFLADPGNATRKVVIKAQVLVGGRGKAGGVKLASTADEAEDVAAQILAMEIKGLPVRRVLVGPAAEIVNEYYLSVVLDRATKRLMFIGSAEGGVEIEQVAVDNPTRSSTSTPIPSSGCPTTPPASSRSRSASAATGRPARRSRRASQDDARQRRRSRGDQPARGDQGAQRDGTEVERLVCLDAKITLDDSALARHPQLEALRDLDAEDPTDVEARRYDLTFIKLDGDIGCMVNGAGLAMTTMDLVKRAGGEPANFLDIGGGAKADRVAAAMRLILDDPNVKAILVNIFGGITRGDEVARGLIEARAQQEREVPMVVRIVGTNAAEAAELLEAASFETAASLDEAARRPSRRRGARREHPDRARHAPRRPGDHRPRGRVPQPGDARVRHPARRRRDAGQGRPVGARRPRPGVQHGRRGGPGDRRQHLVHLRAGRRRPRRRARVGRGRDRDDLLHHRGHPGARHDPGRRGGPACGRAPDRAELPGATSPGGRRSGSSRARSTARAASASCRARGRSPTRRSRP